VDMRLPLLPNNFRGSSLTKPKRSGFALIPQYKNNIQVTVCVGVGVCVIGGERVCVAG